LFAAAELLTDFGEMKKGRCGVVGAEAAKQHD
jgi:hypothetical protein